MILSSKNFILSGDKQTLAFFKSLGPLGRANYAGLLLFELDKWEKALMFHYWAPLLAQRRNLRQVTFEDDTDCYGIGNIGHPI